MTEFVSNFNSAEVIYDINQAKYFHSNLSENDIKTMQETEAGKKHMNILISPTFMSKIN